MRRQCGNKRGKKASKKANNRGVTLVELIIAVAILGIVVTPLLHTFITSARINAKARKKLNETALAENLMEEFNDASLDDMMIKYSGTELSNGIIEFIKVDHSTLSSEIPEDVFVDIYLDPTIPKYAIENDVNLVDLETINSSDSAIYSMPLGYDEEIYKIFEDNSASAFATNSSVYTREYKDFFEKNLDRTIYISLIKLGESAEGIPLGRVEMNMVYEWKGAGSYLEPENIRYTTKTKELFDNSTSETPLNSIYLMFIPRFEASKLGHYDEIKILNFSNVQAKAFIVRQATTEDAVKLSEYKTRNSARITVIEDNSNTPYTVDTTSAIQVRTNMHDDLLSSNSVDTPAELNCMVTYRNQIGTAIASTTLSKKILNVTTVDGRTLDNTSLKNRIYEMKVELYTAETVLSTMVGTKIE